MLTFTAIIKKFASNGEKTGWSYIDVPAELAQQLLPNNKKAFRVKGMLDNYAFEGVSLVPMGGGDFILAVNSTMRKAIGKNKGATLQVKLALDTKPFVINKELLECLEDEPLASAYFKKLAPSHQKYFSNWVESAKTEPTKAKRIAQTIEACIRGQQYGEMIRSLKAKNEEQLLK